MSKIHDLIPVITDETLANPLPSDAPVNVPLVLARHVAELPLIRGLSLELSTKLRQSTEAVAQKGKSSLIWEPENTWIGASSKPGTLEFFFDERLVQVHTKTSPEERETSTQSLFLDANALLLYQGMLNCFAHYLNPLVAERVEQAPYFEDDVLVPEIINHHVAEVVRWAKGKVDEGAKRVELFAAPVADRYGRETILKANWVVLPPHAGWCWEFGECPLGAYLDVKQATWVNGFITLIRLAYPDEWAWSPMT